MRTRDALLVYCKNARINTAERLVNVLGELDNLCWDVICFSETRAAKSDILLAGGSRLITGRADSKHLGVAVLLSPGLAGSVGRIHNFPIGFC